MEPQSCVWCACSVNETKQSFRGRIGTQAVRFVVVTALESSEAFNSNVDQRQQITTRLESERVRMECRIMPNMRLLN